MRFINIYDIIRISYKLRVWILFCNELLCSYLSPQLHMERYRRGHNENDSKSCGLFLCRTPEIPVALGKFAFLLFPMLDDFHTFSTLCSRLVFRSFAPPNFIRSGIEEVITRTTRNRLAGETVRGFEYHPLRQFKSRCKFAYDGIFPRFPVFQLK